MVRHPRSAPLSDVPSYLSAVDLFATLLGSPPDFPAGPSKNALGLPRRRAARTRGRPPARVRAWRQSRGPGSPAPRKGPRGRSWRGGGRARHHRRRRLLRAVHHQCRSACAPLLLRGRGGSRLDLRQLLWRIRCAALRGQASGESEPTLPARARARHEGQPASLCRRGRDGGVARGGRSRDGPWRSGGVAVGAGDPGPRCGRLPSAAALPDHPRHA
mmetsp:Transcript_11089/g.35492  ORF Transcript_11089/g.35492 Transcript_11089/m.35492 type:complete len:216 (-) Transcript_11089:447-1094(-)